MKFEVCSDPLRIHPGEKLAIYGGGGVGKTELAKKLCRWQHIFFTESISRVFFVYSHQQPWFADFSKELVRQNIEIFFFKEEIPELTLQNHTLLIIDDLREEMLPRVADLFLRDARHTKTTIIICFQSVSLNNSYFRLINSNVSLMFLLYLSRANYQIRHLGYQIFGKKSDAQDFIELYNDLSKHKYDYLLLDLRPATRFRIRRNIFPDEQTLERVYECS